MEYAAWTRDSISRLAEHPGFKTLGALAWGLLRFAYGSELRPTFWPIVIVCLLDFALGFGTAAVKRRLKSDRLSKGLVKLAVYGVLLLIASQFLKTELLALVYLSSCLEGLMLLTESVSILEHLKAICDRKGVVIPILSQVSRLLDVKRKQMLEEATFEEGMEDAQQDA